MATPWTAPLSDKQVAELLVLLQAIARLAADRDQPAEVRLDAIRRACAFVGVGGESSTRNI
jgi:hypothetical protein